MNSFKSMLLDNKHFISLNKYYRGLKRTRHSLLWNFPLKGVTEIVSLKFTKNMTNLLFPQAEMQENKD